MQVRSFVIEPKKSFSPISIENPLTAKLVVDYNNNKMEICLDDDITERILDLCRREMLKAVNKGMNDFAQQFELRGATDMIEGNVENV